MSDNSPNRVFVGGISWKADESSLKGYFESSFGPVIECKIIMDRLTGCSKGYGFVTFEDIDTATNVKKAGNLFFLGKMMNVSDAYRKSDSISNLSNSPNSNPSNPSNLLSSSSPISSPYSPLNSHRNPNSNHSNSNPSSSLSPSSTSPTTYRNVYHHHNNQNSYLNSNNPAGANFGGGYEAAYTTYGGYYAHHPYSPGAAYYNAGGYGYDPSMISAYQGQYQPYFNSWGHHHPHYNPNMINHNLNTIHNMNNNNNNNNHMNGNNNNNEEGNEGIEENGKNNNNNNSNNNGNNNNNNNSNNNNEEEGNENGQ